MPFYIYKVYRDFTLELLHTFPSAPLTEADTYRRAESRLRELRRAADPRAGFYLHLIYGEDEAEASARLSAQLGH